MKSIESTGKTIELAINAGLNELGVGLDEVDVEILSEGGLFKKAKVRLTLSEPEVKEEPKKTKAKHEEKETKLEAKAEDVSSFTEPEKEKVTYTSSDIIKYVSKYLNDLLYLYNQVGEVEVMQDGPNYTASLKGDDLSVFIGYHGEVLEAFQVILNSTLANKFNFKGRIFLDVQGYKTKRAKTLQDLAKRMAKVVVKNKKSYSLEPMNSYERRIIHTALQGYANISTHSEGDGKDRHLIIDYVPHETDEE